MPRSLVAGDYIRIDVVDTGGGMDADTLARATEPFFTTKGPGKGTGLGLSMVHGLAVQSGGAMAISSELGRGTAISLWLPQTELSAVAGDAAHDLLGSGAIVAAPDGAGLTVLVVDDDALVSTGTAAMLDDLGYRALEAASAADALQALAEAAGVIDLVITDHAMPGMTGLELAHRLRATYPSLPVILASGYAEMSDDSEPSPLPRLAKPFRQADLAAAISVALGRVADAAREDAAAIGA
jgi:CheY-like chemotaxis protein